MASFRDDRRSGSEEVANGFLEGLRRFLAADPSPGPVEMRLALLAWLRDAQRQLDHGAHPSARVSALGWPTRRYQATREPAKRLGIVRGRARRSRRDPRAVVQQALQLVPRRGA
jgi:hypothetical protein